MICRLSPIGVILILLATFQCQAEPVASISTTHSHLPNITLHYDQAPRVNSIIKGALEHYNLSTLEVDWFQSALFQISSDFVLEESVLQLVSQQWQLSETREKQYWRSLLTHVEAWTFLERVSYPLDPDFTRVTPLMNPRLRGEFHLSLLPTRERVWLLGYVSKQQEVDWKPRLSAREYLERDSAVKGSLSYVWVIQPNGVVERHPIAYWNHQYKAIAPGAIIYVPIPEAKTADERLLPFDDVNSAVIALLQNRVP